MYLPVGSYGLTFGNYEEIQYLCAKIIKINNINLIIKVFRI